MRSFGSLAALASVAFVAVASALPSITLPNGLSAVGNGYSHAGRAVGKLETISTDPKFHTSSAQVQTNQGRSDAYAPPTNAYHPGLLAAILRVTGLAQVDVLAKAFNVDEVDISGISITAVAKLLPLDLQILTAIDDLDEDDIEAIIAQIGVDIAVVDVAQIPQGTYAHDHKVYTKRDGADTLGALGAVGGAVAGATHKSRTEVRGLGDIIVDLNAKIQPLCHDLSAAVSAAVDASAALDVSLPILTEIKTRLIDAKAEIEALVNVEGALSLNGKAIAVHVVAELVATLSVAVVVVVGLVIKACVSVKTDILVALVVDINIALAAIVTLCAKVAVDLVVELKPLIQCVATIILDLKLEALIQVFGLVQA
ncbi:hypothetical protein P691DRAFT_776365 [Macrolepiota fuliginosa MF-IS2]|uniref:Uncharacterized protein n=1 Tax=Macrolepiota fuliginosa MF-IS2 TaxID=1400762 RepID=A0A9P5X9E3_9AGAR|nr:hypothetical protein P691DRAFT_776365 [Macrolepiota fuliginosa MF-IS2]